MASTNNSFDHKKFSAEERAEMKEKFDEVSGFFFALLSL